MSQNVKKQTSRLFRENDKVSQMFKNSQDTFQKIRYIEDIRYMTDYHLMMEIVMKWEKKSDNKELKELSKCIFNTFIYVHKLQDWRDNSEHSFSQYRSDKNRAVIRARESEKKIEELELEIKKLKQLVNL